MLDIRQKTGQNGFLPGLVMVKKKFWPVFYPAKKTLDGMCSTL